MQFHEHSDCPGVQDRRITDARRSLWSNRKYFTQPGRELPRIGSDDTTVKLWQLSDGKFGEVQTLEHSRYINRIVFSPDGNYLASGSNDTTVKLWQLFGSKFGEVQTLDRHSGYVTGVAFSPDGNYLVSGSRDDTAKLWVALRQ